MWRVLVPLLRFAFDCWLGLGAFALVSLLACGCRASLRFGTVNGSDHFIATTRVLFKS